MKKQIKKQPIEYIYGVNSIQELLKAKKRKLMALYTTRPEPKAFREIQAMMPNYPVQIQYVEKSKLEQLVGTDDHQGIVAMVQPYSYAKSFFDPKKQPFIVLLDGVQDVRNVGAILRTVYCTGADGVIICRKGGASLSAAAHKASAGLAEYISIYQSSSVHDAVVMLKKAGYQIYVTAFNGQNAATTQYTQPLCVVIGSEGCGVTRSIIKEGTQITLPQRNNDISYNASVAAGILLFLVGTQIKRI